MNYHPIMVKLCIKNKTRQKCVCVTVCVCHGVGVRVSVFVYMLNIPDLLSLWIRRGHIKVHITMVLQPYLPSGSVGKESACKARDTGDSGSVLGWEDPLGKEMATHSSVLVWEITWTEEPVGLQSMGVTKSLT